MKASKRCLPLYQAWDPMESISMLYFFLSRSSRMPLLFIMDEKKHLGFYLLAKCMCAFEHKDINI